MNTSFDIAKVRRAIKTHGKVFIFTRQALNKFNEPTEESENLESIHGLFHQTRSWIEQKTSEGTIKRSKPQPQILTLVDEAVKSLKIGDKLEYCGNTYKVSGIDNINNLDIAYDISLEMIDNGS